MGRLPREELTSQLMETNEEYRRLAEQHSNFDRRLEELSTRRFPSQEEQFEEMRLKKLKLHVKDQMQGILRQYEQAAS